MVRSDVAHEPEPVRSGEARDGQRLHHRMHAVQGEELHEDQEPPYRGVRDIAVEFSTALAPCWARV